MYEFIIGILPFSDVSAEKVFSNILNRDLEFPEGIDPTAQQCIENLLTIEPSKRIGFKEISSEKYKNFFKELSWDHVYEQEAPFIPRPDSPYDTVYYARKFPFCAII